MKSVFDITSGMVIEFEYPAHNYRKIRSELETRRARVKGVWDTRSNPIERKWVRRNPDIRRGRWLIICDDLDRGEQRKFYWESMHSIREVTSRPPQKFVVVDHQRVRFNADELLEATAFTLGRGSGAVYRRACGS